MGGQYCFEASLKYQVNGSSFIFRQMFICRVAGLCAIDLTTLSGGSLVQKLCPPRHPHQRDEPKHNLRPFIGEEKSTDRQPRPHTRIGAGSGEPIPSHYKPPRMVPTPCSVALPNFCKTANNRCGEKGTESLPGALWIHSKHHRSYFHHRKEKLNRVHLKTC
jgi:hypothetical protein